jgi:hypothetical protein
VLTETSFQGQGAGLPYSLSPGEKLHREGDWFRITGYKIKEEERLRENEAILLVGGTLRHENKEPVSARHIGGAGTKEFVFETPAGSVPIVIRLAPSPIEKVGGYQPAYRLSVELLALAGEGADPGTAAIAASGELEALFEEGQYEEALSLCDSEKVFVNLTLGGPVQVYVEDGKIVRVRPLAFGDNDAGADACCSTRSATSSSRYPVSPFPGNAPRSCAGFSPERRRSETPD